MFISSDIVQVSMHFIYASTCRPTQFKHPLSSSKAKGDAFVLKYNKWGTISSSAVTLIRLSVQFFIILNNKIIHICIYVCMYVCIYIILFTINILLLIKFNARVPTCKKNVLFLDLHKRQSKNNRPIQGFEILPKWSHNLHSKSFSFR